MRGIHNKPYYLSIELNAHMRSIITAALDPIIGKIYLKSLNILQQNLPFGFFLLSLLRPLFKGVHIPAALAKCKNRQIHVVKSMMRLSIS